MVKGREHSSLLQDEKRASKLNDVDGTTACAYYYSSRKMPSNFNWTIEITAIMKNSTQPIVAA